MDGIVFVFRKLTSTVSGSENLDFFKPPVRPFDHGTKSAGRGLRKTSRSGPSCRPPLTTRGAIRRLFPGPTIFGVDRLQPPVLQQRVRQHLLQLAVLALEFLQPLRLVHLYHPKLALPSMERHLRDVTLPADLDDAFATVGLPQYANDLLRRVSFAFYESGSLSTGPRLSRPADDFAAVTSSSNRVPPPFVAPPSLRSLRSTTRAAPRGPTPLVARLSEPTRLRIFPQLTLHQHARHEPEISGESQGSTGICPPIDPAGLGRSCELTEKNVLPCEGLGRN